MANTTKKAPRTRSSAKAEHCAHNEASAKNTHKQQEERKLLRVGILTCAWKRPEITAYALSHTAAQTHPGIEFVRVCVVSEGERYEGWECLDHPNSPLGKKWNFGLEYLRSKDIDALVILGSDDILTPTYWPYVLDLPKEVKFMETDGLYFLDVATGKTIGLARARAGAGRFLRREILERADWKLWDDDRERMLDRDVTEHALQSEMLAVSDIDNAPWALLDIKGPENMWPFSHFEKHPRGYEINPSTLERRFQIRFADVLRECGAAMRAEGTAPELGFDLAEQIAAWMEQNASGSATKNANNIRRKWGARSSATAKYLAAALWSRDREEVLDAEIKLMEAING